MAAITVELREQLRLRRAADAKGQVFRGLLMLALLIAFAALLAVIMTAISRAWPILSERPLDFLTSNSSQTPDKAGVWQGIQGSVLLAGIVAAVAFPIGIGGAIYLEEYAGDTFFSRLLQVVVRNLTGVPSIVYGLLGLAIFVQSIGGITGGRSVISGGLTLACLVLPVVIITTQEAIRAVPSELRQAGYGVGVLTGDHSISLPSVLEAELQSGLLPEDKLAAYQDAIAKMYETPEWEEVRARNGWVNIHNPGDDFASFLEAQEKVIGDLMKKLGFL